jgi:hypothetical protein
VQYQGEGYKQTVAFVKTLHVRRDPFLTQQYMFEYIKDDRHRHRSAGPSNAGSLVDIATRTHAPSVSGLARPTDYHHSVLVALGEIDPFATPPIRLETIRQFEKELAQAEGRPWPFHGRSRQSAAAAPTDQMDTSEAPSQQQSNRQPRKRSEPDSQDAHAPRRPRNVNAVKPERPQRNEEKSNGDRPPRNAGHTSAGFDNIDVNPHNQMRKPRDRGTGPCKECQLPHDTPNCPRLRTSPFYNPIAANLLGTGAAPVRCPAEQRSTPRRALMIRRVDTALPSRVAVSHSISVPLKILGVLITHSIFDSGCDDNLIGRRIILGAEDVRSSG